MRLLIPAAVLLVLYIPNRALAQPITPAELQKKYGNNVQVQIVDDSAEATGVGARATGPDSAKLTQKDGAAPTIGTPWGQASGGTSDTTALAQNITGSIGFRFAAGVVGALALLFGVNLGRQGNLRGAFVIGGGGLGLLLLDILAPEWLELALLAFFAFNLVEYAFRHGLLTGALASVVTAVHAAGSDVASGFSKAMGDIAEVPEAALINRFAKANDATTLRIQT